MDLKEELEKRAEIFNEHLHAFLTGGVPESLYDAARHLPFAGGKRLRPVISMISCEAVSGEMKPVIPYAIALELIHNFTLVHDDIMDHSHLRRNTPTVHVKYGEPTAIIAGDLLFAKAFESLEKIPGDHPVFKTLNQCLIQAIIEVCEGQKLDMEFEQRQTVTEEEYFTMIQKKTAALFRIAAEGGVICGGGTEQQQQSLRTYGESLGMAFQLRDDYLDMSSNEETLGKDIGNDIRNGKKTLIAVHAMAHASGSERQLLDSIFGNRDASEEDIHQVYTLFKKLDSITYAEQTAVQYSAKAINALDALDESPSKEILKELALYAIKREK